MIIDIFLPCRSSSQRIRNKNIKKFSSKKFGLFELKISQLVLVKNIRNVIVSTNDKKIIQYLIKLNHEKIIIDKRKKHLCSSKTKTDTLIKYVSKITDAQHILWTHVTPTFFDNIDYDKSIDIYKKNIKKNDSLMGVSRVQEFIYDKKQPINFNKNKEKWPRTQTLKKLFVVNNAIFINSRKNYIKHKDRIGTKPYLMEIDKIKSFDVDWPHDFSIAENIYESIFKKNSK